MAHSIAKFNGRHLAAQKSQSAQPPAELSDQRELVPLQEVLGALPASITPDVWVDAITELGGGAEWTETIRITKEH